MPFLIVFGKFSHRADTSQLTDDCQTFSELAAQSRHALAVNLWMAVCCLQSSLKVTDILSCRDKQADWILQLNCSRASAAPSLAEDYANKLLPTVLCGVLPSLVCTAVGPGRPTSSIRVCMQSGTFKRTKQTCKLPLFLLFALRRVLL